MPSAAFICAANCSRPSVAGVTRRLPSGERERVPLGDVEAGEHFLGQHEADGVADLAEFQFENHVKT